MDKTVLIPGKCYRILFSDGQPIDFKFKEHNASNDSLLCEKRGGETFFLDTMKPFEKIVEMEDW